MGGAAVTGPFTCVAEQIDGDDARLRRTNVWEEEPPTGGAFGILKIVRIPRGCGIRCLNIPWGNKMLSYCRASRRVLAAWMTAVGIRAKTSTVIS